LGRKLLDGMNPVPILGEEVTVRAKLRRAEAFSGHADRKELLEWAAGVRKSGKVRRTFLVHGEDDPRASLAKALADAGMKDVERPMQGNVFEL
jgi:metallo-beta-lactamase family protein